MHNDDRFEQDRFRQANLRKQGARAVQPETGEDWPVLSMVLGGLGLTLIVMTFSGLIPG